MDKLVMSNNAHINENNDSCKFFTVYKCWHQTINNIFLYYSLQFKLIVSDH